jgi:hypothetical protein
MKLSLCLAVLLLAPPLDAGAEPPDWKELVATAKRHGMPFPPAQAELVLVHTETWSVLGNRSNARDPAIYAPGFVLDRKDDGSVMVLRGTTKIELNDRGEPLTRPFTTDKQEPKPGGYLTRFGTDAFLCAIQCAERGDIGHADAIWKRHHAHLIDPYEEGLKPDPDVHIDTMANLSQALLAYHVHQIREPGADWAAILSRLDGLLADFPDLKTEPIEVFVRDLRLSLEADAPPEGSVEAHLLSWAGQPSEYRHLGIFDEHNDVTDAGARAIVLMGYDAIPDLLRLADDTRMTAHYVAGMMMANARMKRLGELARDLIVEIAGGTLDAPPRGGVDTEFLKKWWEDVDQAGERGRLAAGAFNREGDTITGCNEATAKIIAHKYPGDLKKLCDEFTRHARPDAQPFSLAEAIAGARLPLEQRVTLLTDFAKDGSFEHKRCVLQNLAKIDDGACAPLLIPILRELPGDDDGPYWQSPFPHFSHVVMQIEQDDVWREFLRFAKRSSVGQRMELLNPFDYTYIGDKNRLRRLALLAAFLDDRALRDDSKNKEKWEGPCAAFTFPKIEVRNFAAMQIASILKLGAHPDEFWTAQQWEGLRKHVQAELERLDLPDLGEGK